MNARRLAILAVCLVSLGCSEQERRETPSEQAAAESTTAAATASFVNKVWVVAESPQVATGDLRVFLADGTMVMASSHATPALGSWSYLDGRLTLTEDSIGYAADILELTPNVFRIRIRSPGEPVLIRFAPAEQPALDALPAVAPDASKR